MDIKLQFKNGIKIVTASKGSRLMDVLLQNGVNLNTDCGGRGRCNKCKVKILQGEVDNIDENGYVLSCKTYVNSNLTVLVEDKLEQTETIQKSKLTGRFNIAFDLGSTTLAFSLLSKDKVIERYSVLNKQSVYGADVISRISAVDEGKLQNLHDIVISQLNESIQYFTTKYGLEGIDKVVVAGNTTMLHILLNVSPSSLGYAPYTPVFLDSKVVNGCDYKVNCNKLILLPSFSAFVGADIVSGVYYTGLPNKSLLVDLGTNGEIIANFDGKYYATSTAAGPCLEGATIECGIGGVAGAICKFGTLSNEYDIKTIDNAKPTGICGAGLVDIIATLLKQNIIDNTGALEVDKFNIIDNIYLSSADVREFQLAKSAIYSGIVSLINEAGYDVKDVENLYIAGGIGYHINIYNAMYVGILPSVKNIVTVGNSSLLGAEKCLLSDDYNSTIDIAKSCKIVDLNSLPTFSDLYVENMMFN